MIFPTGSPAAEPEPKTVTLADGQTLTVLVTRPNYSQRFADEGRELLAYAGGQGDAWLNYRLGRIRDSIVGWKDVTNDKDQPIPFTISRLLSLMDVAPEVAPQIAAIANEAFRPLDLPSLKSPDMPGPSGEAPPSKPAAKSRRESASIAICDDPAPSPERLESQRAS